MAVLGLRAPRFGARLKATGVRFVGAAHDADVMLVTGLLLSRNLEAVLEEIARLPQPSLLVAVGDCAINGGQWSALDMAGLAPYSLSHYADIQANLPGDPPSPQDIADFGLRISNFGMERIANSIQNPQSEIRNG
jgi:Ni,Fe-hydrogenase III small subunit